MVILMTPPTAPAFGSGTATSDRSDVAHLPPLPEADGDAEPDADAESELEGKPTRMPQKRTRTARRCRWGGRS